MQYISNSRLLLAYALLSVSAGNAQVATTPPSAPTIPPFTADVVVITSINSPYGTTTQTQTGKYYRASDGTTRQDTAMNSSVANPRVHTLISLNHARKEAAVTYLPTSAPATGNSAKGSAPPPRPKISSEDLGEATISGHLATGKRITTPNPTGLKLGVITTEVWTAADLGVAVLMTQRSPTGTTTQRFENIVLGDPDPQLFTIPAGYNVRQQEPVQNVSAGDPPKPQ
jgi:hypothetical protein